MNVLVSAVALLLASGGFCAYDTYSFRMALVRNVAIQAQIIGDNTVSALLFNDPHSAEKTLSALRANPNLMYAQIYTRDGQPFAGYWRDRAGETTALPPIPAGQTKNHWFKDGHLEMARSIIFQGKPVGTVYIRSDLGAMNDRLRSYALIVIAVLFVSLLVTLVAGIVINGFMGSLYSRLETGDRFIDLSVDMFCIAGFDGFFKNLNPSFEKTLGFTAKELMSKPYFEFIHPDDRQATADEASRLQKPEVTFAFENRYLCKDGSYKWLSWNAVSTPEQKIIYAVARDVTERKLAEEALRESQERLRLLVNGVKDYGIFMLDPTGAVASWNPGAERIEGYRAHEIIGRHFSCFYPPEDVKAGKPERALQIAMAEGRYEEEGWRVRKDGSPFWANVLLTALTDGAGKLRGFSKITRDITEHRRAEQRLQESEERHRKLFDNNPHPTWVFDRETLRFLAVNAAAVKKYGYSNDEFLAMTLKDIRPPEDIPL